MAAGELNVLTDDDHKTLSNMFVLKQLSTWALSVTRTKIGRTRRHSWIGSTGEFLPARLRRLGWHLNDHGNCNTKRDQA